MIILREKRTPSSPWPPGIRERWIRSVGRSTPLHNALFALFVGGILAYGAAFAWYICDRFDLLNLLRLNQDDAYYYFQTAWHMANGNFSTFDGGITRTNGYHPLWMFLIVPFYWVFDKVEALYAIKAFEIMLVAGGVALVAGAARVARLPWILLFGALPTVYLHSGALFSGLEAAAGLFMLGALFITVSLYARDPAKWRLALAVVAFALPWVRLEYVAISAGGDGGALPSGVVVAGPLDPRGSRPAPRPGGYAVPRRRRRTPRVLRLQRCRLRRRFAGQRGGEAPVVGTRL